MPSKRWTKFLTLVLLLVAAILGVCAYQVSSFLDQRIAPPQERLIRIKPGSSFTSIARAFEKAGIVSDARLFILLARWENVAAHIHAGEYRFAGPATPQQVLDRLTAGDVRRLQLTIPEGFTLKEIAGRIEAARIAPAAEIIRLATDAEFLEQLEIEAETLEGYLFPETYTYTSDTLPEELLAAMLDQFRQQLTPELVAAARQRGLNPHQLVTLASIIQKEAGNNEEMPLISAVFHNRLDRRIPLQADPTVIYGVEDFDGNLTRRHLKEDTPYNTYRRRGLPPGPIASPGSEALQAAAFPADVGYLYFVSKGDGSHAFSATLKEHNRAVRKYQLRR